MSEYEISDDIRELCQDFVTESREVLEEVEPILIELESSCADSGDIDDNLINTVFRAFHSMKGSGGFLELANIVAVTHQAESLLDIFRQGKAPIRPANINALCRGLDFTTRALDQVEAEAHDHGFESEAEELVTLLRAELEAALAEPGAAGDSVDPAETLPATPAPQPTDSASPPATPDPGTAEDEFKIEITPEMVEQFMTESLELLEAAEASLLELEGATDASEPLNVAFRSLHSFKGNCGFLGYPELERLAHRIETILDEYRSSGNTPDTKVVTQLLGGIDALQGGIGDLPDGGGHVDPNALNADPPAVPAQAIQPAAAAAKAPAPPPAPAQVAPTPVAAKPAARPIAPAQESETQKPSVARGNIRVDLDKLDTLMDLVGELIIAETMVTHNPDLEGHTFERFQKASVQLNRITRSLQDVAMGVRMVPIGGALRKMLRLARDLAQKQNKQIELVITGEHTEVDKTVVEAIADPLVHIIRNSADHGIESPAEREAAGKPRQGTIQLGARHQGGEVWVEIIDDGKGLDRDVILAKARRNGLPGAERDDLRDSEIFRYIFEAGFSTAETVTDVSGRGVGMDVVRRNIAKLKGRVDVASQLGAGTTITIRIPLTLAIIEGMMVRVGESVYTVPLLSVRESVNAKNGDITKLTDGREVANIRGQLLPLLRLHALHQIEPDSTEIESGILVIVEEGNKPFCMLVDQILGQRQTVIKALPDYLGKIRGISGCSILSSGDISLILDVQNLQAQVFTHD